MVAALADEMPADNVRVLINMYVSQFGVLYDLFESQLSIEAFGSQC